MDNGKTLKHHVIWGQDKPSDFQGTLDSIRFMREELGIDDDEMPDTPEEANYIREQLKRKVQPPTEEQLDFIDFLLSKVGGTMSGALDSHAQAETMIEALLEVRERQFSEGHGQNPEHPFLTAWREETRKDGLTKEENLLFGAAVLGLFVLGFLFPRFGSVVLFAGLAALVVGLPMNWLSGGRDGNYVLLFAAGAIIMGIASLVRLF